MRQTRGVHADAGSSSAFSAHATHGLANGSVDGWVVQPLQEAIQRSEIGHAGVSERLLQFAMFAEPHFGFAKSPVFVAHQTKDRQQLGLCELVFAENSCGNAGAPPWPLGTGAFE